MPPIGGHGRFNQTAFVFPRPYAWSNLIPWRFICNINNEFLVISLATSSKDDLHRRIGGRCSTNNMKVVFKVCCAPETDSRNATTTSSSENGHTDSKTQIHANAGNKQNQYPQNNRGTSINTDTQSSSDGRVPQLTINTSNGGNIVQSTMTWMSRNDDSNNNNVGNYPHSTPITSTGSAQQYYPHPTSSRPFINSAINNKNNKNNNNYSKNNNNNNNYNHSNFAPSHKPTKKISKYTSSILILFIFRVFEYQYGIFVDIHLWEG